MRRGQDQELLGKHDTSQIDRNIDSSVAGEDADVDGNRPWWLVLRQGPPTLPPAGQCISLFSRNSKKALVECQVVHGASPGKLLGQYR